MTYTLRLPCGCLVCVLYDPQTGLAQSREIQSRGAACAVARHRSGVRVFLWELLPDRTCRPQLQWVDPSIAMGRTA